MCPGETSLILCLQFTRNFAMYTAAASSSPAYASLALEGGTRDPLVIAALPDLHLAAYLASQLRCRQPGFTSPLLDS